VQVNSITELGKLDEVAEKLRSEQQAQTKAGKV
jgi:hypothetical protein